MINFDDVTKENIKWHNLNWTKIPDHTYRILIIEGSWFIKTNSLFNRRSHRPDIDKVYLYTKDPSNAKYQLLINKHKGADLNYFNDSKALIECSNYMDDIYENIEEYNRGKEHKRLIIFDGMIADMLSNKKRNPVVSQLFIRGRKLNISFVFIKKSYFSVPKNIRLNSTHYFAIKIPSKIACNHSSDIEFRNFMNLKIHSKADSFLVIDSTLASDNLFHFRKSLLERI